VAFFFGVAKHGCLKVAISLHLQAWGGGEMERAKQGDVVKVHYTGRFEDGTVFDSSLDREPLQVTLGAGEIIPGVERAIVGMKPGDSKTEIVPSDQAYGPHDAEMVFKVGRNRFPDDVKPELGQDLQIQHPDGRSTQVLVTGVSGSTVTLDANHPLAGKDLIFDLQLVTIS
jgi:peptidylprolyl isomerase